MIKLYLVKWDQLLQQDLIRKFLKEFFDILCIKHKFLFQHCDMLYFRYNSRLDGAKQVGIKRGLASGLGSGFVWIVIFGAYGLAFWYGTQLVLNEGYDPGDILQVSLLLCYIRQHCIHFVTIEFYR